MQLNSLSKMYEKICIYKEVFLNFSIASHSVGCLKPCFDEGPWSKQIYISWNIIWLWSDYSPEPWYLQELGRIHQNTWMISKFIIFRVIILMISLWRVSWQRNVLQNNLQCSILKEKLLLMADILDLNFWWFWVWNQTGMSISCSQTSCIKII